MSKLTPASPEAAAAELSGLAAPILASITPERIAEHNKFNHTHSEEELALFWEHVIRTVDSAAGAYDSD